MFPWLAGYPLGGPFPRPTPEIIIPRQIVDPAASPAITAPQLPVNLGEMKAHSRIDGSDEDTNLETIYLPAAVRYVEKRLSVAIMEQTLEITLDTFPWYWGNFISLTRAKPLTSIAFLRYTDSDGVVTDWDTSNYIADKDSYPGRIVLTYGNSWPSFVANPVSPIRIRYVAGATDPGLIDERLKIAVMRVAANMFEFREADNVHDNRAVLIAEKYGVDAFLDSLQETWVF
jgi:uncharacterized phiE125 gp8 family phage protein